MRHIAIIGSGPMGIYLLKHLVSGKERFAITIFEALDAAGVGMPYNPDINADYMLCNAFSREIPAVVRPLVDWLKGRPEQELSEWELSRHDLTARAFYPRVLIGEYLKAEFEELCANACKAGHRIKVHTGSRVTDITTSDQAEAIVHFKNEKGAKTSGFHVVVIASGHIWPENPQIDDLELVSPWPYTNIIDLEQNAIGILGSSLSAIDIVVAIAHARGHFEEIGGKVSWLPNEDGNGLQITMVSRQGIMPEADFYYQFPYAPLVCITQEAVDCEIAQGTDGLLDRVFALLCDELDAVDPDYLDSFEPSARSVEGFAPAYFARRREIGDLRAVKRDLAKARATLRLKETIPHRYALLRGHETFDRVLRELTEGDYNRFIDHLMPVFADCYAAVPHLSLARIVALYDAGVLSLVATVDGAEFSRNDEGMITAETEDGSVEFSVMIDARGQFPRQLNDLPFPELVNSLRFPDKPLLQPFELDIRKCSNSSVFCLSLPQILSRYPFSQGLLECFRHARCVSDQIITRMGHKPFTPQQAQKLD